MTIMAHYRYVAGGLVFVGQLMLWAECIAPNDFDPICRTDFRYRVAHDWIPYANDTSSGTWKVLIDQYDYENLLDPGPPPKVWSVKDVDGTGTTWGHGSGGTCSYQVQARSNRDTTANNWIFTQAIDYLDAVELIVNATVRFTSCSQRISIGDCTNDYAILHRYDTSTLVSTIEGNNTANYRPYLGTSNNSRLQQDRVNITADTIIIERFRRPPAVDYTYLGIQDVGTIGSITRIFMYYEVCPGRVEGLVTYPEIPYPGKLQGALPRTTRLAACAEHAHNTTSLETYAHQDGRCVQAVSCECDMGYERHQNGLQCIACPAGRYRSAQNRSCVDCPANSASTMPASGNCNCNAGYYRKIGVEGIGVSCTAPPPRISSCVASEHLDTSITIRWTNPAACGGRSDCNFMIRVNDGPPQLYSPAGGFHPNRQETYIVGNLQPDTTYSITVSIHNGVSDQDADNARLRECSFVATTIQGSVFMLGGVTYLNNTAVLLEDIAEGDSLTCTTSHTTCCAAGQLGQFYYPNDTAVSTRSQAASSLQSLYMTHNRGSIGLSRQRGSNPPLGRYRCEIPDGRGTAQSLYIRIGTAIDDQDQSNTTEPAAIDVAAVVGDVIVLNIPDDMTDVVEVRIEELQREGSKPPTKAPIIFRADVRLGRLGGPRVQITIPPESTAQLEKDSSYFVKIKPIFKNKSEGEYGVPYIFKYSGSRSTGGLSAGNNSPEENTNLIIAVVATFVGTAIIISLLAISIALLCKTYEKKSSKLKGTTNPEYPLRKSSLD